MVVLLWLKCIARLQDPRLAEDHAVHTRWCNSRCLLKAFQIGALPVHIDWIQQGPWASPDERGFGVAPLLTQQGLFVHGIAVDVRNGKRFMNEMADRKTRADAEYVILREAPKMYPVVLGTYNTFGPQIYPQVEKGLATGVMKKFDTLDALAANYKIPADALKESVKKYNETAMAGKEDEFKKQTLKDLKSAPIDMKDHSMPFVDAKTQHTMGGLKIDTKARVLSVIL